jgi:alkyl sulfatase BDS1-like metallo-beta-lactamase superfamily hydrolase
MLSVERTLIPCNQSEKESSMTPLETLKAQNSQFPRQLIKVSDNVYTATGYSAANVSMIIGDSGLIIIDTTESTKAASLILEQFRTVTALPVKTIIYTHGHRDHISGASVFAENGQPDIVARSCLASDLTEGTGRPAPVQALLARTKRQFGMGLKFPEERINIGIGPGDRPLEGLGAGFMPVTKSFDGPSMAFESCGIKLEMHAAPGETPDQAVLWYGDQQILFCADNFYHSFPNLYAIRGTRYRDFDDWADTAELMLGFNAQTLCTGHTLPVIGAASVKERLSDYRDAIRSVISQTIEQINAGHTPDEIAATIRLPDELANKPWLQEFYGKVSFAARAYFAGTIGWFDGNPTSLQPVAPAERANRLVEIAGGADAVWHKAQDAAASKDLQWAMELLDMLSAAGHYAAKARAMKADLLVQLADQTINAPIRNYYLVCAQELRSKQE